MEKNLAYVNGKFVPCGQAMVSVLDHGFLYGDGVFDTMRAYDGTVFKLKEHVDRLFRSAGLIGLEIPISKQEVADIVVEVLRKNKLRDAYMRVTVSRGVGEIGLDPDLCETPTIVVLAKQFVPYPPSLYEGGVSLITSSVVKNDSKAINPNIKSTNFLNNILAKIEAKKSGAFDALMLTGDGFVSECTTSNIFIVSEGALKTPPKQLVLEGITRNTVLDVAKKIGVKAAEEKFRINEVYSSQECFITNTSLELMPVVRVDDNIIGDGRHGKLTKKLLEDYRGYVIKATSSV